MIEKKLAPSGLLEKRQKGHVSLWPTKQSLEDAYIVIEAGTIGYPITHVEFISPHDARVGCCCSERFKIDRSGVIVLVEPSTTVCYCPECIYSFWRELT